MGGVPNLVPLVDREKIPVSVIDIGAQNCNTILSRLEGFLFSKN